MSKNSSSLVLEEEEREPEPPSSPDSVKSFLGLADIDEGFLKRLLESKIEERPNIVAEEIKKNDNIPKSILASILVFIGSQTLIPDNRAFGEIARNRGMRVSKISWQQLEQVLKDAVQAPSSRGLKLKTPDSVELLLLRVDIMDILESVLKTQKKQPMILQYSDLQARFNRMIKDSMLLAKLLFSLHVLPMHNTQNAQQ